MADRSSMSDLSMRELRLTLSPAQLYSYDTNTSLTLSLTDAAGRLDEFLGKEYLDGSLLGRFTSLLFSAGTSSLIGFYSHEFAHLQPEINMGMVPHLTINFDDQPLPAPTAEVYDKVFCWEKAYDPKTGSEVCSEHRHYPPPSMQGLHVHNAAAGLNQQIWNMQALSALMVERDRVAPDHAVSYIFNRAFLPSYVIFSEPRYDYSGNDDQGHIGDPAVNYDPTLYRMQLNSTDSPHFLSFDEHVAWSTAITILNGRMIDSVRAIYHYLDSGTRDTALLSWKVGGAKLYLPELDLLHHPEGLLLDIILPVKDLLQQGDRVRFNPSVGVAGGLETYRLAIHYDNLKLSDHGAVPRLGLVAGATSWSAPRYARPLRTSNFGYLIGATAEWELLAGISLHIGAQLSFQDPIESDLKGIGTSEPGEPRNMRANHCYAGTISEDWETIDQTGAEDCNLTTSAVVIGNKMYMNQHRPQFDHEPYPEEKAAMRFTVGVAKRF